MEVIIPFFHFKISRVIDSREKGSTDQRLQSRGSIATWDENTFPRCKAMVEFNGNAMRGILRINAMNYWKAARTNAFESNQANAGDGPAFDELWPERLATMLPLCRSNVKIYQHPAVDGAVNFGHKLLQSFHGISKNAVRP